MNKQCMFLNIFRIIPPFSSQIMHKFAIFHIPEGAFMSGVAQVRA